MHTRLGGALFVYLGQYLKIVEIGSYPLALHFTGMVVFLTHHPPQTSAVNFPLTSDSHSRSSCAVKVGFFNACYV